MERCPKDETTAKKFEIKAFPIPKKNWKTCLRGGGGGESGIHPLLTIGGTQFVLHGFTY